ncbi:hypothetical protein C0Q70_14838 [Pomacea canaliculata]|uniref:Ubiquitin-like domain-containing protein n=1 Tax=Pomacea canaliculata TaxID=400727 RepID=A0A2T7NT51_POMCA|nr:hypothetical protein C0Q70_14838 [Pomacea canaliculata]
MARLPNDDWKTASNVALRTVTVRVDLLILHQVTTLEHNYQRCCRRFVARGNDAFRCVFRIMADDEASQLKEQPQTEEGEEATAVEQSFENLAEETPKEQTDAPTEVPTDPGEGGQQTDAPREVPTDPGEGGQQTAEDRITDLGKEDATEKKEEIVQVFSEENPALQGKSAEQDTDRAPEEVKPEDNKHTREEAVTPDKIMPESQMSHPEIKQESAQEHLSIDLDSTATVKIVLMPSGQVVTMACTLGKTLLELKRHFASELKMSVDVIMMIFDGRAIEDTATLADLGVGPNGTVQIEIQSSDPVNNPSAHIGSTKNTKCQMSLHEGEPKDVVVEIERTTIKKPFLGGYRHKINGIEFHNAAAQTVPLPRASSGIEDWGPSRHVSFKYMHTFQSLVGSTTWKFDHLQELI